MLMDKVRDLMAIDWNKPYSATVYTGTEDELFETVQQAFKALIVVDDILKHWEREGYISRNHAKIIRKAIESPEDTK